MRFGRDSTTNSTGAAVFPCEQLPRLMRTVGTQGTLDLPSITLRQLRESCCEVCFVLARGLSLNQPGLAPDYRITYIRTYNALPMSTDANLSEDAVIFERGVCIVIPC